MATPARVIKRKRALKKYVVAHGGNPRGLNFAPIVGPVARKWIRWLEKREWPTLPTTGRFDSRVLAVLFPPKPETIGHKALAKAESVVGVKEQPAGSNDGPVVRQFQAVTGAFHAPWCGSLVGWAFKQAGRTLSGFNVAYVPSWVATAHAGAHGLRVIGVSEVVAGDVVCFDWGHDGIADHIGICAGPWKNGTGPTVEGNTSAGSNSNGGQVQERVRSLGDVCCFIRVT